MIVNEFSRLPVAELIPHTQPMVLIDRIVAYQGNDLTAELTITPDVMFYDSRLNGVPAWAAIEYMAQAIAALGGIRALEKSEPVKLGLLLGTRRYVTHQPVLQDGMTFQVTVRQLIREASGLACFDCTITHSDELVCSARLNVFEAPDLQTLEKRAILTRTR